MLRATAIYNGTFYRVNIRGWDKTVYCDVRNGFKSKDFYFDLAIRNKRSLNFVGNGPYTGYGNLVASLAVMLNEYFNNNIPDIPDDIVIRLISP